LIKHKRIASIPLASREWNTQSYQVKGHLEELNPVGVKSTRTRETLRQASANA